MINGVSLKEDDWYAHKGAIVDYPSLTVSRGVLKKSSSGILKKVWVNSYCDYQFIVNLDTDCALKLVIFDANKSKALSEGAIIKNGRYFLNFNSEQYTCVYVGILFDSPSNPEGLTNDFFILNYCYVVHSQLSTSPYKNLPPVSFWKSAVANTHFADFDIKSIDLDFSNIKVATAGSCFAQHLAKHLKSNEVEVLDLEPRPTWLNADLSNKYGFDLYTCRYGNIYTVRQLLQLQQESLGLRSPKDIIWSNNGLFFDALRPSVTPNGHDSVSEVILLREKHLSHVRRMWSELNLFVFTLGLTEAWERIDDGTIFPTAPNTIAGVFSNEIYKFKSFNYVEIYDDLINFFKILKSINPSAKLLLTVSPVPLTATASGKHVLVANAHSKSILRAVAGQFADDHDNVYYFPSYELITSPSSRSVFYNYDLRTVNSYGVNYVMSKFLNTKIVHQIDRNISNLVNTSSSSTSTSNSTNFDLCCDDDLLDRFDSN